MLIAVTSDRTLADVQFAIGSCVIKLNVHGRVVLHARVLLNGSV